MITIQLVGGPDDGTKLKIARHRYELLMPQWRPTSVQVNERIVDEAAACDVSVYRKVAGSNRYRFVEVRQL